MAELFNQILEIIDYMKIPLIVGILLCTCASLLGTILVTKRLAMMGDGLSHVAFGTLSVAFALNLASSNMHMLISIPIVIFVAYILIRLSETKFLKGDAAVALISSSALAIGYLSGNLTDGFSADIGSFMFGSITTASKTELLYIVPIAIIIILFFILMINKIFAVTFDESFAKATGVKTRIYSILLAFAIAVVIVIGINTMGTLLISSLVIFPTLSAMRLTNNFVKVVWLSVIISIVCFVVAFFAFAKYSSAAGIVVVNLVVYLVALTSSLLFKKHIIRRN